MSAHRVIVAEALVKVQIKSVVSTDLLDRARSPRHALLAEIQNMDHDLSEPLTIDPQWVHWWTEPIEIFGV